MPIHIGMDTENVAHTSWSRISHEEERREDTCRKLDKIRDHRIKQVSQSKKNKYHVSYHMQNPRKEKKDNKAKGVYWGKVKQSICDQSICIRVYKCLPESHYCALIRGIYCVYSL